MTPTGPGPGPDPDPDPNAGVWSRLLDALTVAAMLCNAMLMSQLLASGLGGDISSHLAAVHAHVVQRVGSIHAHLSSSGGGGGVGSGSYNSTAGALASEGLASEALGAAIDAAADVIGNATAAATAAAPECDAPAADGVGGGGAATPMALLLSLILLRLTLHVVVPSSPRWLVLLHRRRAHFEEHGFQPAKLHAAADAARKAHAHATWANLRGALHAVACAPCDALWRRRWGAAPAVPEWRATGRTDAEERLAAAHDAEAFAGGGAFQRDQQPQGKWDRIMQRLVMIVGTIGVMSTELL